MTQQEYSPIRDYWESHWLAIRIKRDRGDDYFLKPSRGSSPDGYLNGWGKPIADHGGAA